MSKSRWVTFSYDNYDGWCFPQKPAVYVVYLDGSLTYIGQSSNIKKRIQSYKFHYGYSNSIYTPWGKVESLMVKISYSKKYGDWAMRELRLIKKIQPIENCVLSTKKRGMVE